MDRKDILEEVKHFTTRQELHDHKWEMVFRYDGKESKAVKQGECLDSNKDFYVFQHIYEKGLRAEFKRNDDGTFVFINSKGDKA
jgi:hypothetical protein